MKTAITLRPKVYLSKSMSVADGATLIDKTTGEVKYKVFHGGCLSCTVQRDLGIWACTNCHYFDTNATFAEIHQWAKYGGISGDELKRMMESKEESVRREDKDFNLGQFIYSKIRETNPRYEDD